MELIAAGGGEMDIIVYDPGYNCVVKLKLDE